MAAQQIGTAATGVPRGTETRECTTYQKNVWEAEFAHEEAENPQLAKPQPGVASTFMARRSVFEEIGDFNAELKHRDLQDWLMRAKLAGWKLLTLDDVLVERRIHGNNISRSRIVGSKELLDMASQLLNRKKGNGVGTMK